MRSPTGWASARGAGSRSIARDGAGTSSTTHTVPAIQANGVSLEYESFGNPSDPVILLVMGLGMQMVLWPDAFCEMLAARGFRVIRFDNRDAGLSTQFDHLGMPRIGLETVKYLLRLPVKAPYLGDDMARETA